jgi:O-antigen/teichoic acid export membrane protein
MELTLQISRALFPTYSKISHDLAQLREAFLNSFAALVIVNVAFGLGLFAVSHEFVAVVLGAKWGAAGPLVAWLAIAGLLRGLMQSLQGILIVCHRERIAAVLMFVRFVALAAAAIVGGVLDGAHGIAAGVTIAMALLLPLNGVALGTSLGVHLRDLLRVSWRPVIAGVVMVLAVDGARAWLDASSIVLLAVEVAIGAVVFGIVLLLLWRISGKPPGPERLAVQLVTARLSRKRVVPPA